MAKKTNTPVKKPVQPQPVRPAAAQAALPVREQVKDPNIPAWLYDFKIQAIVACVLALVLYFNTFKHEYALDDTIVIVKNEYVHEGFKGIDDIFTKDAFDSYYRQFNSSNQLSGGRYRPLSIATFAIEQQFFGSVPPEKVDSVLERGLSYEMKSPAEQWFLRNMHIRHVFNVLWYMGCIVVLLYFLRYIVFKENHIMALIAVILFTAHPIHTEVIANVKSRDEIMSLLLICSTFIFAFKYHEHKKTSYLAAAMVSMFLAFLAKEYAITLLLLLPLAFYVFNGFSIGKCFTAMFPYFGVVAAYLAMRFSIVGKKNESSDNDLLNNPYANADETEQLATKISTSLNYLKLLIFPHPLSSDYSYNTIPYKNFAHPQVWASLGIHGAMFWQMFKLFTKRHVLSFALAFYLINLLIVSNLIFNLGGTMGERLVFHSSVGFCIIVAYFLYKAMEKIKPAATGRLAVMGCVMLITVLYGFKTIDRNKAWKNDETLFFEDIKTTPNSVLVNSNVASSYINMAEANKDSVKKMEALRMGIKYYNKVLEIHPTFVSGFMNRGVAYLKLGMPDSAKANYDMAMKLYPNYPKLFEVYYNLGVCYYLNGRIQDAIAIWQQVMRMNPQYVLAQQSINTATMQLQQAMQQAAAQQQMQQQQPPKK